MSNKYINELGVFDNKLGIKSAALLNAIEYSNTQSKQVEILTGQSGINLERFGLETLKAIHKYQFDGIYEWAGKLRTIPLAKELEKKGFFGVFANPDTIVEKWDALEEKTAQFAHSKDLSFEQKRELLVDIFIEANHIHPFPEGNGRTLQTFMTLLAAKQDVTLDYGLVNSRAWNQASAVSGIHGEREIRDGENHLKRLPPDDGPIREIFARMASPRPRSVKERIVDAARGFQVRLSVLAGNKGHKEALAAHPSPWGAEQELRASRLDAMRATATGAQLVFAEVGAEAMRREGSAAKVNWREVEDAAITSAINDHQQPPEAVFKAILETSPMAVAEPHQTILRVRVDSAARKAALPSDPSPSTGPAL